MVDGSLIEGISIETAPIIRNCATLKFIWIMVSGHSVLIEAKSDIFFWEENFHFLNIGTFFQHFPVIKHRFDEMKGFH